MSGEQFFQYMTVKKAQEDAEKEKKAKKAEEEAKKAREKERKVV